MDGIKQDLTALESLFGEMAAEAKGDDAELYDCPLCRDTGYLIENGYARPCTCRNDAQLLVRKTSAGLTTRLRRMRFDNFELRVYPADLKLQNASYRSLAKRAFEDARRFTAACIRGEETESILFEGEVGCGKTHLAAAITNELLEAGKDVLFLVVPEFLDSLRASYRRENEGMDETEIIKRAYQAPVLILDDLGAHNYTEWVSNKLFTIINHRYNRSLPCVITTTLSIMELEQNIGERAASRMLESCHIHRMAIDRDMRYQHNLAGLRL